MGNAACCSSEVEMSFAVWSIDLSDSIQNELVSRSYTTRYQLQTILPVLSVSFRQLSKRNSLGESVPVLKGYISLSIQRCGGGQAQARENHRKSMCQHSIYQNHGATP